MREKLTALLITLNEEDNIRDVLNNLRFADEIIVVDSFSTDKTLEIIKEFKNIKLIQREFKDFSDQRKFAVSKAKNNWILFLDADERISKTLKEEMLENLKDPKDFVAFCLRRKFFFKNHQLKFSGYQTNRVCRLFHKEYCFYNEQKKVHETLRINGKIKKLQHKLNHYSYKNEESYKNKLRKYASLRAEELLEKKKSPNFFHFYIKPSYRFLNQYIIRLGFLDGKKGYKISKLNAYEVKQRYEILKKILKDQKN